MSNTYTTTISGAQFSDGTKLSGSFTATYDDAGKITSISNSSFTVKGMPGTTVFGDAYVLGYADPNSDGIYELTFGSASNNDYEGLYIDYKGETPSMLNADGQSFYTSVRENTGAGYITLRLTDPGVTTSVACFVAGTLILTDRGEVAVEELAAGDLVRTLSGDLRPIRWIGRRSYGGRFFAAQRRLRPVVFQPGSLGDGLPRRALRVSQRHAMLLDGVLVPAVSLVNGTTVTVDDVGTSVAYFHVELDTHDVLWAEGAPSETFIDEDSRGMFHNAATAPETVAGLACAPRVEDGVALARIRDRLNPATATAPLAA